MASILLVEDDDAFAYAAARHLESVGIRTTVVSGAMEALRVCEKNKFDLAVIDLKLLSGEPHGLSLARMIRNTTPGFPVIIVTAYPEALDGEVGVPGRVLQKPVELADLEREINACLATRARR
jgi:CheY-like chemotaxis protein